MRQQVSYVLSFSFIILTCFGYGLYNEGFQGASKGMKLELTLNCSCLTSEKNNSLSNADSVSFNLPFCNLPS